MEPIGIYKGIEKGDDERAGRPVYLVIDHGTKIERYLVGVVVQ